MSGDICQTQNDKNLSDSDNLDFRFNVYLSVRYALPQLNPAMYSFFHFLNNEKLLVQINNFHTHNFFDSVIHSI